jgi:hypothetical protein
MTAPNRLRDQAPPNVVANGSGEATPPARRRRGLGLRHVAISGVALAVIGIPFFFGAGLQSQEVGLGLIAIGAGIAITVTVGRSVLDDLAASRRSLGAALVAIVLLPHTGWVALIGLGMIGFGALVLAIAAGLI